MRIKNKRFAEFPEVQKRVQSSYQLTKSWRVVASVFGISCATARRIAGGHEPEDQEIRDILGLAKQALCSVCPSCGGVHPPKRCPARRKPRRVKLYWFEVGRDEQLQIGKLFGE